LEELEWAVLRMVGPRKISGPKKRVKLRGDSVLGNLKKVDS